jgi:hypothetical protein
MFVGATNSERVSMAIKALTTARSHGHIGYKVAEVQRV